MPSAQKALIAAEFDVVFIRITLQTGSIQPITMAPHPPG